MIQGITTGAGGGALGRHLADTKELNEDTRLGGSRGLLADTIKAQIRELSQLASASRSKSPIAHFHADPDPRVPWNNEQWNSHWARVEQEFGLRDQPFSEAIHLKDGREHRHRAYSLFDARTGNTIRLDHFKCRNEKLSRLAEFENGHAFVKGKHNRAVAFALERDGRADVATAIRNAGLTDGPPAMSPLTPEQRHQQDRTGIQKADVAMATANAWQSSDGPQAFIAAMSDAGMRVATGDKTVLVVDQSGNSHSLTRMLSMAARANGERAPRAAEISQRMEGIELPDLSTARAEIRTAAQANAPTALAPTQWAQPEVTPSPPTGGGQPNPVDGGVPKVDAVPGASLSQDANPGMSIAGGGGASAPATDPVGAMLDEVGPGPGEPPGYGASPDQLAKYRAALAAYDERKARAWEKFIQSWTSTQKKTSGGNHGNMAMADGVLSAEQAKASREAIDRFFEAIGQGTVRAADRSTFELTFRSIIGDHAGRGYGPESSTECPAPERPGGSAGEQPGGGHAPEDDGTHGPRIEPIAGDGRHDEGDGRCHRTHRDETGRQAFSRRCEAARVVKSANLIDLSGARRAIAALLPGAIDARIDKLLNNEQHRISALLATAPTGERNPDRAARQAKSQLMAEQAERQKLAIGARTTAQFAAGHVRIWNHLPLLRGPLEAARAAQAYADDMALTAEIRRPSPSDLRDVGDRAERMAAHNQRQFDGWNDRVGKQLNRDEEMLQSVREAVVARDPEILKALDRGGYAAAKTIQEEKDFNSGTNGSGSMGSGMAMASAPVNSGPAYDLPTPWTR
jgi:hypothetical protein